MVASRLAVVSLAAVLLAGCTGAPPQYRAVRSSWVGQDQQALFAKWGYPSRSFTTDTGIQVLIYDRTNWQHEGGGGTPGEAIPIDCSTAFSLRDGRIFGVKAKGAGCS